MQLQLLGGLTEGSGRVRALNVALALIHQEMIHAKSTQKYKEYIICSKSYIEYYSYT